MVSDDNDGIYTGVGCVLVLVSFALAVLALVAVAHWVLTTAFQ